MAYDNPGPGGDESLYDGPSPKGKEPESEDSGQKTYVLPKAVFEGKEFEPGDELVLRIVSMDAGQIEVTYAPAKEQEKGDGQEAMAQAPAGGSEGGGGPGYSSMME